MNEIKHTPGPWVVKPNVVRKKYDSKFFVYSAGTVCESCNRGNNDTYHICVTLESAVGMEQAKANAKLIAAAPELLDALQTMMIGIGESEIPNDGHSTLHTGYTMDILILAKNAIKKATE